MTNSPGPAVLLIEDDAAVRRFLRAVLPAHGYRLIEAETGEEGVRLAKQAVPDLVLLDLGLPDLDGLEVMSRLRSWTALPIVVISARDQEMQKVQALDEGADDYITKPVALAELLARIRVALRHATRLSPTPTSAPFVCGELSIELERRRVSLSGEEVRLSPIEFKLLQVLAEGDGRVVTHKQMLKAVWGPHSERHTEYLRVYMAHLRRKLEPDPGHPQRIITEAGIGYRLQCGDAGGDQVRGADESRTVQ